MTARTMTVDLTPSWGEFGLLYARFAESGERTVVAKLRHDHAVAMAAAEALKQLEESLSPEQLKLRDQVIARELALQIAHLEPMPCDAPALETVEG